MRVVDDAMAEFAPFQALVLGPSFPWHYARATKKDDGETNPYLRGWVHLVFKDGQYFSPFYEPIWNGVLEMLRQAGEPATGVFRIRLVLNTISDRPYLNGAHVDLEFPHKTALLYLNDADGDTVIYDQRFGEPATDALTVAASVAPVAGRAVLFDGLQLHTGTTPTKVSRRIVLNVNYE